jgi:dihydrodipicolinate synthase/N-acetylneuraminate lyase
MPETYFELSKHPNIVGTKEANGDLAAAAKTAALCGENLAIYSGEDNLTLPDSFHRRKGRHLNQCEHNSKSYERYLSSLFPRE